MKPFLNVNCKNIIAIETDGHHFYVVPESCVYDEDLGLVTFKVNASLDGMAVREITWVFKSEAITGIAYA